MSTALGFQFIFLRDIKVLEDNGGSININPKFDKLITSLSPAVREMFPKTQRIGVWYNFIISLLHTEVQKMQIFLGLMSRRHSVNRLIKQKTITFND